MKKDIRLKAHDGGEFDVFTVYPETDLPSAGIVLIQEIFGVNDVMRTIASHLSQAGYIVMCPDLFWRQEPGVQLSDHDEAGWKRARELMGGFDIDLGIEDLKTTVAAMRAEKDCIGKVGTVGYCLGGKLAYLMATRGDADCNVAYYGVEIDKYLDESQNIEAPLLMHIAEKDKFVPMEAQEKIIRHLNKDDYVEILVHPGVDHAFARVGGEHYDKEAAHRANYRTADFLATHLAKTAK